jgi:hypothetical protein
MAAGEDFRSSITGAGYLGTSRIDGVECDHLAIRQADVDWQVSIETDPTPVPRRLGGDNQDRTHPTTVRCDTHVEPLSAD